MTQESNSDDNLNEGTTSVDVPEEEEILTTTASRPESRSKRFIKLAIRWVIGLSIVFVIGF